MHYTISLSENMTFLVQKMMGEITCEVAIRCAEECHLMGKQFGITKFLVDVTEATNVVSVVGNYNFAYRDLDSSKINKTACVALLVNPGDTSHDFLETLCRNAGHNVTLFRDRKLAERHLQNRPQP